MTAETIRLWPDGPPFVIEGVGDEVAYPAPAGLPAGTTFLRNISDPTLSIYPAQGEPNGIGVIVVPGGGWTIHAWDHEGVDVARWLSAEGFTAFLLKYRVQASGDDQAAFEAMIAEMDGMLAVPRSAAQLPGAITDLISTDAYLQSS